jgi:DMSO/TMAO reductase YedYZ heme-binding membrane subunit
MIKVLMDLLVFLRTTAPLLTSLIIFVLLFILLSKSIKKHAKIYYFVFSIPFLMHAIPTILRWCGVEMEFSFSRVPILGEIIRDYIHMASLGHPLMIIIMYMGALDMRNPYVKRLMSIRKEISIISGFPIFTHSLVRVANNFPNSLKYFTNHAEYMDSPRITSELGAGISSFSLVLGIVMLALFIPLWITSFDSIRKRMENIKWKKLQRWSYPLYTMMFIHAMGIQVGGMISRNAAAVNRSQNTEIVAEAPQNNQRESPSEPNEMREDRGGRPSGSREIGEARGERATESNAVRQDERSHTEGNSRAVRQQRGGGRTPVKGFADFNVSASTRQWISICVLFLIYGSYLFLRVRKAKKKKSKESA